MLEVMSAKDYAKRTNYPLETIRKMCREGDLPCDKRGKVYLIDVGVADTVIKERMLLAQAEKTELQQIRQRRRKRQIRSSTGAGFDFIAALKAI